MKLALVLGVQQGNVVKPKLQGIKDNLEIDCFANIGQFIDLATKRSSLYDRILILSTLLDYNSINSLYKYWASTSRDTQVVVMCRKGQDEDLASEVVNRFMTPAVAVMLVSATTVTIIAEAVLRPTNELNKEYGVADSFSMEFDDDLAYVPEESALPEDNTPNTQVSDTTPQQKEKRTFFSALFGGKKKSTTVKEQEPLSVNENIVSETVQTQEVENVESLPDVKVDEDFGSDSPIEEMSPPDTIEETGTTDSSEDDNTEVSESISAKKSKLSAQGTSSVVEEDFNVDFSELFSDDESDEVNDFVPQQIVEEDFGDTLVDYSAEDTPEGENSEVDEDLSGLDISGEEETYRHVAEAPKVVTKTVVKEVIRNVGSAKQEVKYSTLDGVYKGKYRKIIVVTGDRGSGVTSTALNIARTFAQKVSVLYFDCDIYNHGVLNYIDYNQFSNFEMTHHNGVKMCKSSLAFNNCVISYDTNFDLLTTDFSCDATVEELHVAHEVVSEQSDKYQVIVVDCPVDCLQYIQEFVMSGNTVLCVEGSKRGFMNMLCRLEANPLSVRFKRNIVSRGTMLVTKCHASLDLPRLHKHIKAIFESDGVDWLSMTPHPFDGRLDDALLNEILEG